MLDYKIISFQKLYDFTHACFLQMGINNREANIATNNLLNADLRGIDSHGVARLSGYVRLKNAGRINPSAVHKIIHETPSTATIDADKGLGLVIGEYAMETAIQKASNVGTGWVAVKNSNHFGIAASYAMMALDHDMIGIAMTNASALVAPTFSKQKMLGTNPISYAFPAGNEAPFVADFATTTAANGKLEILQREEKETPDGWVQNEEGNKTNDAHILKKGGALLPLGSSRINGGHKGFALGSIVDILSGVLSGASFGPWAPPFPAYVPMPQNMPGEGLGHFFGAMRIDAFRSKEDFKKMMDVWIQAFKNAQPISENQKVIIPGEPERLARKERLENGIPLIKSVWDELLQLKNELNITTPLY